jgi:hypothetical protein
MSNIMAFMPKIPAAPEMTVGRQIGRHPQA